MKPRLIIPLILIVGISLALVGWVGVKLVLAEKDNTRQRFAQLLEGRLVDAREDIRQYFNRMDRELMATTDFEAIDMDALRLRSRSDGAIDQFFVLDDGGRLLYPHPDGPLTERERSFLARTADIWAGKSLIAGAAIANQLPSPTIVDDQVHVFQEALKTARAVGVGHGWYIWYWGQGLNVLFWRRQADGTIIGAELSNVRVLADVIGLLPEAQGDPDHPMVGAIHLIGSSGEVLYQWGRYAPAPREEPKLSLFLTPPLYSWRLDYYVPSAFFGDTLSLGALLNIAGGLIAVAGALIGLSVYFYRESVREIREAGQRVSFVNQVSHELKIPLTNIRMYAELLETTLDDDDERSRRYLEVVVDESQRLSRLIANILTFSRNQRGTLSLRCVPGVIDETVASVIRQFEPAFAARGIATRFAPGAPGAVTFDHDALEQILGNLFSNVEKYAAGGGALLVTSRQENGQTIIEVADRGRGIAPGDAQKVFRPFCRLSDDLTEGATGAGIGLTIARDLARLHGGDLRLAKSDQGARFEVVLNSGGPKVEPATGTAAETDREAPSPT